MICLHMSMLMFMKLHGIGLEFLALVDHSFIVLRVIRAICDTCWQESRQAQVNSRQII
jgi:hypothetical protein